jgi:hypothetical protein
MSTITFDTFKFVDRLEKAGLSREQASAIVDAQKEAFSEALGSSVATKADLAEVKAELKADIALVRSDMQALELRLTIKLGTLITVAVGTTAAIVKLL